jgi:DNA-binding CsgD family transcriptional regulator/tetratricopeptide (TPR) repeat protein
VACPRLVGRESELALLGDARRALAQSRASIVLIAGEAGIGKTRLLSHFLRRTGEGRARRLASAECLEHALQALGPIRSLLRALGVSAEDQAPDVARALGQLVPSGDDAARLPVLEKSELFGALATVLRSLADERATIVAIEDIHWADAATLEFLAFLAPRIAGSRLLVIATYRSDEVEANETLRSSLARMTRESTVRRIDLRALGASDFRNLLAGALDGHAPVPAETLHEIEVRAEGNPFFGEELLKSAIERGEGSQQAGIPLSIRTSILERLAVLTEEERRVIARAAVFGVRFSPVLLSRSLDLDIEAILPTLRRARDLNIIVEDDADPPRFHFRHALTRQTVYDGLLRTEARRLHQRILETLEAGENGTELEQLAYHAFEARDRARTLLYNERAGDAALSLHALTEARTAYERALETAEKPGDRARLSERVGTVRSMQGHMRDAIEVFETALALYREVGDLDRASAVVRAIVADKNNSGDVTSIDFGSAFLDRDGPQVSEGERDALIAMLARLACIQWNTALAHSLLARIAAPERLGPRARQNYLITRMDIAEIAGAMREWQRLAPELIAVLPDLPPFLSLVTHLSIAQSAIKFGLSSIANEMLERIDRLERRVEFGALHVHSAAIHASAAYLSGRLDRARAFILRGLEGPPVQVSVGALCSVAPHVAARLDEPALFAPLIEGEIARARSDRETENAYTAAFLAASAEFLLSRGRLRDARSDLVRGLACVSRAENGLGELFALGAEHLQPADLPMLERMLAPDLYLPEDLVSRAHVALASAILARRKNDDAEAVELASAAAATYRELGWPLFEARALEVLGDPEAALVRYERCGSILDIRRLATPTTIVRAVSKVSVDRLSAREREVAALVADGLTNGDIGERLAVSKKTVEKHLASIFDKLGIRSRAQLAALLARDTSGGLEAKAAGAG